MRIRKSNIAAAHRHLRRVHLDCYKLMCIHQQDYIENFKKKFRFCNTNDVDDGNFDINLHHKIKKAEKTFKEAKNSDRLGSNDPTADIENVYDKYLEAFTDYTAAVDYIDLHYEGIVRVARKTVISKAISFLGWAISIALAIVLYFLQK